MNSVLLGNLKLSLQSAALPAPQPASPVQLALSPDQYEKPLALSPLTTSGAPVISFEIEVPRKPICWCVRLSLFGETAGVQHNRLLLQVDLYLLACVIHEINIIFIASKSGEMTRIRSMKLFL